MLCVSAQGTAQAQHRHSSGTAQALNQWLWSHDEKYVVFWAVNGKVLSKRLHMNCIENVRLRRVGNSLWKVLSIWVFVSPSAPLCKDLSGKSVKHWDWFESNMSLMSEYLNSTITSILEYTVLKGVTHPKTRLWV